MAPSVSVLAPLLVNRLTPASTAVMVAGAELLMTLLPLLTAIVSGPPVPVFSVQLYVPARSPKTTPPSARAPSRVRTALLFNASLEKSAVTPLPLPTRLFDQFPATGQEPPAGLTQTALDIVTKVADPSRLSA